MTNLEKARLAREDFLLRYGGGAGGGKTAAQRFRGIAVRMVDEMPTEGTVTLVSWRAKKTPPTLWRKVVSAWQAAVDDWRGW